MSDVKQLKIETYNLVDFVMQVQEAVLNGYTVNDSSDDAPMCIGNCYHVIMREKVDVNSVLNSWCDKVEKGVDKRDNKELGTDEAYAETVEPPKEPTLDESLPKDEQAVLQTKQTNKRGRKQ